MNFVAISCSSSGGYTLTQGAASCSSCISACDCSGFCSSSCVGGCVRGSLRKCLCGHPLDLCSCKGPNKSKSRGTNLGITIGTATPAAKKIDI